MRAPWYVLYSGLVVVAFAPAALAEDGRAPAAAAPGPGRPGGKAFAAKFAAAQRAAAGRDFAGAVEGYRAALQEEPQNAYGQYALGEAQELKGDLNDADATWQTALRNGGADEGLQAKLLFAVADLRERQGHLDEAKTAWLAYASFVAAHPKAKSYPATATERARVVDVHNDLAQKYGEVKRRIEARVKELAAPTASPPSPPPPPSPKKPAARQK